MKKMSTGLSFMIGTLFGAVAVFVPLASAGHTGSRSGEPPTVNRGEVSKAALPDAAAKEKAPEPSNQDQCDVQLD
ncbi:MAG: hypothetical protein M3S32_04350 [Acidobacteriota bacterium]|nr:hypothetical protein [Acidobacteriota bacterium]